MDALEKRVALLEETVQKIIALPYLSNLAGRDISRLYARIQYSIDENKARLANEELDADERKRLEEEIIKFENLVLPALSSTLDDSAESWRRFQALTDDPNKIERLDALLSSIGKRDVAFLLQNLKLISNDSEAKEAQIQSDKKFEEFEKLCSPLVEYLQKKCNPHSWIIIQWDGAWLAQDRMSIPFKVPD